MIIANKENDCCVNTNHIESFLKADYKYNYSPHNDERERVNQIRFCLISGHKVTWEYPTKEDRDLFFDTLKGDMR